MKNKSIIEIPKAKIHDMDIPMFLWAKACNMVVYILNKGIHEILKDKTPKEDLLVRNHRYHTFMFLVVLCIFISLMKRDPTLNLLDEGYFCGI